MAVTERGQAVPLLLVVLALAVAAALLVGEVGAAASRRARAQTAADAAALAGAAAGEAEARAVAYENDGKVELFRREGAVVTVTVRVADARATASAEAASVAPVSPAGGGDRSDLAPAMLAALARADQLIGAPVQVVAGAGLEVEVSEASAAHLREIGREAGLCQLRAVTHPLQFATCPPTRPA
jgi:hypothetical protein